MSDIDIADVLEKAADDIATNGLAKRELENEIGQHCAIGAIAQALGAVFYQGEIDLDGSFDPASIDAAATALLPQLPAPPLSFDYVYGGGDWNCVVNWNNHPDRTADEVVEAMRQAAKDLRNEATP
jgi:hypothetical protein